MTTTNLLTAPVGRSGPINRDVVIIGAGQAGLAIGYHLALQGRDFTILDAAPQLGGAWRSHWDSLKLFTPARYDGLPGKDFPGPPDHYPTRDEVVDYLTEYARSFELPVELNSPVRAVRKTAGGYVVELDDRTYEAAQVVIATGPFQTPRVPDELASCLDHTVTQMHSSEYRRPGDLPITRVLVVGGGNTGFQIAEELAADGVREVHLSVGSRQTPFPTRILGRELFSVLSATGFMTKPVTSRLGRRLQGRAQLVGSSPRGARRLGIRMHGRAVSAFGDRVSFADGTGITTDAVIWATGFGLDHSWIDSPVFDEAGHVVQERGVTASPGLYFIGLPWLHTRGSALLGWVKHDAAHLAQQIASFAPTSGSNRQGRIHRTPTAAQSTTAR
jgi:putative flavoprotein involved in K+ transport